MGPTGVDWLPGLSVLAAGLAAGALLVWRLRAGGRAATVAISAPLGVPDLEGRRDALLSQLQELEDTAAKRTPEQLARERYALELEAAGVLRELTRRVAAAPAAKQPKIKVAAPASGNPALRGFLWGLGSAAALGGLVFFAAQAAKPREEGGSLTGNTPSEESSAAGDEEAAARQALARNPDDLEARLELARLHLSRQDLMGVFNETRAVLELSPGNPRALSYQALVRLAMGQGEVAVSMLKQALASAPDLLEAYIHLTLVYTRLGRDEAAAATVAAAARRFPERAAMLERLLGEMRQAGTEPPPADDPHQGVAPPPGSERPASGGPAAARPRLMGTLELDPSLAGRVPAGALVFVTVRAAGVSAGPPVAVKRLAAAFPLRFEIGSEDSMMGQELPERLRVEARVDRDGDPLTRDPADPSARADGVALGSALQMVLRR